jgi:hypothetical protein
LFLTLFYVYLILFLTKFYSMGYEDNKRQSSIEKQCAFKGAIEYLKDRPDAKKEDVVALTDFFFKELFSGNVAPANDSNGYTKQSYGAKEDKPASESQVKLIQVLCNKSTSVSDKRKTEIRTFLTEVSGGGKTFNNSDVQLLVKELNVA